MSYATDLYPTELIEVREDYHHSGQITFRDGRIVYLHSGNLTMQNQSYTDGAESNGIPIGNAICKSIQIEIANYDDEFSDYDFIGAKIDLAIETQMIGRVIGTFYVVEPETYGDTIILSAVDAMHKADKKIEKKYPSNSAFEILRDICTTLNIPLKTTAFLNSNVTITLPEDITYRQAIGYIAMLASGNARIDAGGNLCIVSLPSQIDVGLDGGTFAFDDGDHADGGSFMEGGINADGGDFSFRKPSYHTLSSWNSLKVDTDDVVITGVQCNDALYGEEGYVIGVQNFLGIADAELAYLIGSRIIGLRFRKFEGDHISFLFAEFGDICVVVDRKGNRYPSFITDIHFVFGGFTTFKNSAENAIRNSSESYSSTAETFIKVNSKIEAEKTARELALEQMANTLATSSGLYKTNENQQDGSVIYYMHDKPVLGESDIVWKVTADAFGVSTDGGKTYQYGLDANGIAILNRIYANGIDATYIDTGVLRIANPEGEEIFYANINTGELRISNSITYKYEDGVKFVAETSSATLFFRDAAEIQSAFPSDYGFACVVYDAGINVTDKCTWEYTSSAFDIVNSSSNPGYVTIRPKTYLSFGTCTLNVSASYKGNTFNSTIYVYITQIDKNVHSIIRPVLEGINQYSVGWSNDYNRYMTKNFEFDVIGEEFILYGYKGGYTKISDLKVEDGKIRFSSDIFGRDYYNEIIVYSRYNNNGSYVWTYQYKIVVNDMKSQLDGMTQEAVFNALTNNGEAQGLFLDNGQLYLNFSYGRGGVLKLGGLNNTNGILQVNSEEDKQKVLLDNSGIDMTTFEIDSPAVSFKDKIKLGNVVTTGSMFDSEEGRGCIAIYSETQSKPFSTDDNFLLMNRGLVAMRGGRGIVLYDDSHPRTNNVVAQIGADGGIYAKTLAIGYVTVQNPNAPFVVDLQGNMTTTGTKARTIVTDDYGPKKLYAYETPNPYFGDIGEAELVNGECTIYLDQVFLQTIEDAPYQVFLQEYGEGKNYVAQREKDHFIVRGTCEKFGWEVKCIQKDCKDIRF